MPQFSSYFYKLTYPSQLECRLFLDIKGDIRLRERPDLFVVMLNPGSCKNDLLIFDRVIEVRPDATLIRVKSLIEKLPQIQWIRILNLSDIIQPKSDSFFKKINEFESIGFYEHSIFCPSRREKLLELLGEGDTAIIACGTDKRNKTLLKQAIETITSIGVTLLNRDNKYYHPLVRPNMSKDIQDWRILVDKYYSQQWFGAMAADE